MYHSYEENANRLIGAMKERHAAELKAFQQRLISKTSTPKFSKELLNLRKIQDVLAKKKECVVVPPCVRPCVRAWVCNLLAVHPYVHLCAVYVCARVCGHVHPGGVPRGARLSRSSWLCLMSWPGCCSACSYSEAAKIKQKADELVSFRLVARARGPAHHLTRWCAVGRCVRAGGVGVGEVDKSKTGGDVRW